MNGRAYLLPGHSPLQFNGFGFAQHIPGTAAGKAANFFPAQWFAFLRSHPQGARIAFAG